MSLKIIFTIELYVKLNYIYIETRSSLLYFVCHTCSARSGTRLCVICGVQGMALEQCREWHLIVSSVQCREWHSSSTDTPSNNVLPILLNKVTTAIKYIINQTSHKPPSLCLAIVPSLAQSCHYKIQAWSKMSDQC